MKYSDINIFCCPKCRGSLDFFKTGEFDKESDASGSRRQERDAQEGREGWMICADCHSKYPIIESIPRFSERHNYAASFGYQWRKFNRVQVGVRQEQISRIRFYKTTRWNEKLHGELVLEVGCGAGRFTKIALDTGAEVYSFDLSGAVEANMVNIESDNLKWHHHLFQADIYQIPLRQAMFDKIFCLGVLQHCPDPKRAYLALAPFLKPGGELVVDCYLRQPLKDIFKLKYLLRPLFKWWRPFHLFVVCTFMVSIAYDLKSFFIKLPLFGKYIAKLIPIGVLNYEPEYHFSVAEMKEIKTLSLFDMVSPKYDRPQRISDFRLWMAEAGLEILTLVVGYNGINARGRRPKKA